MMATEYKLPYTGAEINSRLTKVDNMVTSVNGATPDSNGNVSLNIDVSNKEDAGIAANLVSAHNSASDAHSDIRDLVSAAQTTASEAKATADDASSTATSAQTAATTAQTAASSAQETANAALPKSGGTMTGVLTAQNNTSYTTKQARNIFLIAEGASMPSGSNGDICLVYAP